MIPLYWYVDFLAQETCVYPGGRIFPDSVIGGKTKEKQSLLPRAVLSLTLG
jgi:hypothetical protein